MTRSLFKQRVEQITLRPYQQAAVDSVYAHLRQRDDNPCVVIPTGGGKTPVMATICKDAVTRWGGRVLILAHVKELLQQAADKLNAVCPEIDVGVYSAGLKSRDTKNPVIVAGVQSVYRRACELDRFDLVLVDECHLIPADGEGMYRSFLADALVVNPNLRVIGFTATPYRTSSGLICSPDNFLNSICYEVGVRELIVDGFLSPLKSKAGIDVADTSKLHIRGGEFIADEIAGLMDDDELVSSACSEIVAATAERRACLIFSAGVEHGRHICRVLAEQHGVHCGFVCGETTPAERARTLAEFKERGGYLCNVNVLTTGFDAPNIDTVVLLRPTNSPGLYYQMVGRGFRLHPDKQDCLVLDFGGNVLRHGPVDKVKVEARGKRNDGEGEPPAKECEQCKAIVAAAYAVCPECGFQFPESDKQKHDAKASGESVLSGEVKVETFAVMDVHYALHTKKGASEDDPKTMRVDYRLGLDHWQSEWICFEHTGFARRKAESWWKARSHDPIPSLSEDAVTLAEAGSLAAADSITVRTVSGDDFPRVTAYELGEIPEAGRLEAVGDCPYGDDEIPF